MLPHMPYRNTGRCWCGGRWCIVREQWRNNRTKLLVPTLVLLALATTTGAGFALVLGTIGWPVEFRLLAGVVVSAVVVAGAAVA